MRRRKRRRRSGSGQSVRGEGTTHFFTASNGKLPIQNVFEARPARVHQVNTQLDDASEGKGRTACEEVCRAGLHVRYVLSECAEDDFVGEEPASRTVLGSPASGPEKRVSMNAHHPHPTPEHQRRSKPVPQSPHTPDLHDLLRAVDWAGVQPRTGRLHLEAGFEVFCWAGDDADCLACEESCNLYNQTAESARLT